MKQRRRTQIRLAQRAYRQRKETTISGLNRRVSVLEHTIEDMNKTFIDFKDKAVGAGIEAGQPALAEELRLTADRLTELARSSIHDTDLEEDEAGPTQSIETSGSRKVEQADVVQQAARSRRPRREGVVDPREPASMWGYSTTFEQEEDDGEIAQLNPIQGAQLDSETCLSGWNATESMQQNRTKVHETSSGIFGTPDESSFGNPEASNEPYEDPVVVQQDNAGGRETMTYRTDMVKLLGQSLPMPASHSSQETSFARRLMRTSLENAYRLLTSADSRPADIQRICTFGWSFTTSSRILDCWKNLLKKTANENLEFWGEVPQRHLGGAGLHYPRVGIDAGGPPPEWWATNVPMGPRRPSQAQTPVPDYATTSDTAQDVGFGGEWFDANDVEQYLRAKGLYLNGQSSIVEINEYDDGTQALSELQVPSTTSSSASSSMESTRGPQSPQTWDANWSSEPFVQSTEQCWGEDLGWVHDSPDYNMDFSFQNDVNDLTTDKFPLEFSNISQSPPSFNTKMKKFVDVEKFLNSMYVVGQGL